jgi:hypothetical protein
LIGFRVSDFGFFVLASFEFIQKEPPMHLEHAERKRDLRLRRRILQLLHAARVHEHGGWASGRFVVDVIDGATTPAGSFGDDAHAAGLLRDLVAGGYVEQRDDRAKGYQPRSLDFISFRITHRGTALVEEQIDPDPLVEDDRVRTTAPRRGGRRAGDGGRA